MARRRSRDKIPTKQNGQTVRCTRPPLSVQYTLSGWITWTGGSSAACWDDC